MTSLILAGKSTDTWGISGPEFVSYYLVAMVLTFIIVRVGIRLIAGPNRGGKSLLDGLAPEQIALLTSDKAAIATALASLLRPSQTDRKRAKSGGVPAAAVSVRDAVSHAQSTHRVTSFSGFAKDPEVRAALKEMRADLRSRGLLLSPVRATALHLQWVLPLALTALGLARCIAGHQNHKPIANIIFFTVVSAIGTLVSLYMARTRGHLPRATSRALYDLRKASRGLLPKSTSGNPGNAKAQTRAPMSVALFGTAALLHAAPDLSASLGIPTLTFATLPAVGTGGGGGTDTSSSTWTCSSSSCGSSCGSSNSCGG